ncbi:MAG TPA: ThuA domain-containing protein [Tepidisphaeraceae bacterium]|nr:ThuA domain-containing protein [Tepidisphaeraceae bacterium]
MSRQATIAPRFFIAEAMSCRRWTFAQSALVLIATFTLLSSVSAAAQEAGKEPASARVVIVTGLDYPGHPWKLTTPVIAEAIRKDKRLTVDIQEDPKFLASPKLHEYGVLVLNYMNWESPDPGNEARENLRKFVAGGKGLFLVHFTCGAFQGWPEFREIAGRVWDPKLRGHDPHGTFRVEIVDKDHPITRGMAAFETADELYTCLTGDKPIHVLAVARSKVDQKDYPMAFVLEYGKGRVFHTVLGHDVKALTPPAVQDLFRRGCEWIARLSVNTNNN